MPRLSNVTLKAMALTGNPANRRPIHAMKSAAQKEEPMPKGPAADLDEALQEPSAEVLKALSEVKLTKAAGDADAQATAEAVGRLLAAQDGLTFEDVLAVAKAAGKSPVAKGGESKEDEGDDMDDEDMEDDAKTKGGKFKKGNPWAEKMKKSAEPEDVLKSAPVEVAKAIEAMRQSYEARITKAERDVAEERDHRLTGLIKSEMVSTFKNLGVDHDKLTSIVKSARASGKASQAADLLTILKAADAQLGLAQKSGGSAFANVGKTTQFGAGGNTSAMGQINAHVDAIVQKGEVKKSRPQLVDEFLMTDRGMALWAQHMEEKGA